MSVYLIFYTVCTLSFNVCLRRAHVVRVFMTPSSSFLVYYISVASHRLCVLFVPFLCPRLVCALMFQILFPIVQSLLNHFVLILGLPVGDRDQHV